MILIFEAYKLGLLVCYKVLNACLYRKCLWVGPWEENSSKLAPIIFLCGSVCIQMEGFTV